MALVISAFPGSGKTEAAKRQILGAGAPILDLDSSSFSWLEPGVRNPAFPENYISSIKEAMDDNVVIFVSSHSIVRETLRKHKIPYVLVWPRPYIRWGWVKRFFERNDSHEFIKTIIENWFEWMEDATEEEQCMDIPVIWLDEHEYISTPGVMGRITEVNLYRTKYERIMNERVIYG